MAAVKIRYRRRAQANPPPGMRQAWDEWQVVDGRKVIGRFDMEHQAAQWCAKNGREVAAIERGKR